MNFPPEARMSKTFIATLIMLFLINSSFAQKKFIKGYITMVSDETILVDLYIPASGKLQTKKDGGKTVKYRRRSLRDYGYLENGKKTSRFTATAFPVLTYEGYYITTKTGDTTEGYFVKWNNDEIVLYQKENMLRYRLNAAWMDGFAVKKYKTYECYDKIDYIVEVGMLDYQVRKKQFCQPKIKGKIILYKTEFTIRHSGHMGANGIMTGGSNQRFPVYVFVIGDETYALEYRRIRSDNKILRELETIFADYPALFKSIDRLTFEKRDIPDLVRKYNEHFERLED